MLNTHELLMDAEDDIRDAIVEQYKVEIPDKAFDIEAIVDEVFRDEDGTFSPIVTRESDFWIIVNNHKYEEN